MGYVVGDYGAIYQIQDNSGTISITAVASNAGDMFYIDYITTYRLLYCRDIRATEMVFIYRIDAGNVLTPMTNISAVGMKRVFYLNNQNLYPQTAFAVGLDGNLLKTTDDGLHWTQIHTGLKNDFKGYFLPDGF